MREVTVRTSAADGIESLRHDLAILSASWDRRGVLLHAEEWFAPDRLAVLKYQDSGATGQSSRHLKQILAEATSREPAVELDVNSVDIVSSWSRLRQLVVDTAKAKGRPLNLLVDLSAMPRYLSLGILGYGFASGLIESIDYYYVAAAGYRKTEMARSLEFTGGRWLPWPIVGLGGPSPARASTHLVVTAGFEGNKTKKLVDMIEPDRISIVYAEPGSDEESEARCRAANASLAGAYLVPEDNLAQSPLNSELAVQALHRLLDEGGDRSEPFPEISSFLLAGPKPISLAAAVVAMRLGRGDVLYIRPDEHRETEMDKIGGSSVTRVARPWATG